MFGLILVTWEKYLSEHFGDELFQRYRERVGGTTASVPLANRNYEDDVMLQGVGVACELTQRSVESMLRGYGRYFILNGLTNHFCAFLLSQIHSARDLLLVMRAAHEQLRQTPDALSPPLFAYENPTQQSDRLVLLYDSPRQLCPLLHGAIEGAATRYGERVEITEQSCMRHGAACCRIEIQFLPGPQKSVTHKEYSPQHEKRVFYDLLYQVLPESDGITFFDIQKRLKRQEAQEHYSRPHVLLKGLQQLQHVGLICTTTHLPGDSLAHRRYWRAPAINEFTQEQL